MATAKLWWNGSAWVATETNWFSGNTGSYPAVVYSARIIAYDDITIKLTAYAEASTSDAVLQASIGQTFRENGASKFTLSGNSRSFSGNATISSRTAKVSHGTGSGESIAVYRQVPGTPYGTPWTGSHTTDLTDPFCTITYNANGGSGAPASHEVCIGAACALSSVAPTRSGYVFKGWSTSSTAVSPTYQPEDDIVASDDLTLYAVWNRLITITAPEGVTITLGSHSRKNNSGTYEYPRGTYALSMVADTGWLIKTRSTDEEEVVVPTDDIFSVSATSVRVGCFIDTGTAMTQHLIYIDNGSGWELYLAYRDTGTGWELLY